MNTEHIIRAWRDEEYRESLDTDQLAMLPESPVGTVELLESELAEAEGGLSSWPCVGAASNVIFVATYVAVNYSGSWMHGGSCRFGTDSCC